MVSAMRHLGAVTLGGSLWLFGGLAMLLDWWQGPRAGRAAAAPVVDVAAPPAIDRSFQGPFRESCPLCLAFNPLHPPGVVPGIDPDDSVERVLILTPGGPVVIEASILLDGRPFRERRERLVAQLLRDADTDGDGRPTWKEALANPRFAFGDERLVQLSSICDANGDGTIDRDEARALLARFAAAAEFSVPAAVSGSRLPDVFGLLDSDADGSLSADEIAAAPARLTSRDANDNDVLVPAELEAAQDATLRIDALSQTVEHGAAFPLGPGANRAAIRHAVRVLYMRERRITAECFPAFPRLVAALDQNGDGELNSDEIDSLCDLPPQIAVLVKLGAGGSSVRLKSAAPELVETSNGTDSGRIALLLPGTRIRLAAIPAATARESPQEEARRTLARLDADGNGYLDWNEVEKSPGGANRLNEFARWDANGDGTVDLAELQRDVEARRTLRGSRVTLLSTDRGLSLYNVLDKDSDGRLGLREIRNSAETLRTLDRDQDGRLTPLEMPGLIDVAFAEGDIPRSVITDGPGLPSPQAGRPAPRWFVHMDRNRDGDVTLREFLGTPEQFRALDANGDGFIDPRESAASNEPDASATP